MDQPPPRRPWRSHPGGRISTRGWAGRHSCCRRLAASPRSCAIPRGVDAQAADLRPRGNDHDGVSGPYARLADGGAQGLGGA